MFFFFTRHEFEARAIGQLKVDQIWCIYSLCRRFGKFSFYLGIIWIEIRYPDRRPKYFPKITNRATVLKATSLVPVPFPFVAPVPRTVSPPDPALSISRSRLVHLQITPCSSPDHALSISRPRADHTPHAIPSSNLTTNPLANNVRLHSTRRFRDLNFPRASTKHSRLHQPLARYKRRGGGKRVRIPMQTAAFVLAAPLPCPRARPTRRRARPVQAARPRATRARSSAALDGADDARARLEAALRRELPCFFQRGLRGLVGSLWAGAGAGGFASDVEILFPFVERLVGWPSLWFILVFIHRLTVWHTLNAKIDVESIAFEAVGEHLLVCTYNIYTDVAETVAENESDPEWLAAAASLASSRIEGTAPVVAVTVRTNVHFELASGKISCWEESYSLTQLQYFRLFLDAMNKEEELIAKRMHHLRNQNPGVRRGPSAEGALPLERSAYDKRVAEIVHFLRNDFPRHLYPAAPLPASDEAEGTVSGSAATPLDYSLFDDLGKSMSPTRV